MIVPPMQMQDFKTLGHTTPNVWVKRPILVDKDQLVEIFYLKATLTKCYENVGNQENPSISIWLDRMPNICCAKLTIVGNLCSLICHQIKTHLQIFAST